jgi:hypothetical protein
MSQDSDTFPGSRFVGVSWRPGADPAMLARLKTMVAGWSLREGAGWLLAADRPETFAAADGVALLAACESARSPIDVCNRARGGSCLRPRSKR